MSDLTKINSLANITSSTEKPFYGWYKEGSDYVLNMGRMERAVVVRACWRDRSVFFISDGSYFPFSREIYDMRFETPQKAVNEASDNIKIWLSVTIENLGL